MIEPNPLRELKNTLGQILIAGVFFWFAAQGQAANNRMAANPHASAAIEGTWTRPGQARRPVRRSLLFQYRR